MRRSVLLLTALSAAFVVAAPAQSHGSLPQLVIRHQLRGCHAWSYEHGAYKASQSITANKGTSIVIVDNDFMPHKLVQLNGPAAHVSKIASPMQTMHGNMTGPNAMNWMGATLAVAFPKAGTYTFKTIAGEDYMEMKTVGKDNVLRLTVVVH